MQKTLNIKNLSTLLLALTLSACATHSPSSQTRSKSERLNKIVDDYFEASLKLDPLFATSIGDHRFDSELTIPISKVARAEEQNLIESTLNAIKQLNCKELNHTDTLTCLTVTEDLDAELQLLKSDLSDLMPFNQFSSFFSDFAELASGSSYISFENKTDYENFLSRLKKAPAYLDTMIANMRIGMKRKITTPRSLVKKALKQTHDLIAMAPEKSVFYKPLLKFDSISSDQKLKQEYEKTIKEEIYPAYRRLEKFVKYEYLPHARLSSGISSIPGGSKNYLALARIHTTTKLNPEEIRSLGLSEVKRISIEFEKAKASLGFKGSLKQFFASLRKNKELFPFSTSEEVLNGYRAIYGNLMKKIPEHFRLLPQAKFEIREVEKFKAESASEAYQNGTPDGSRPGIFWVPVPDATKYGKKNMESLFLHEAIPGHHFQISIQQELDLPRYRRFNGNNAYVEGWGLYAESLGKELGLYSDPIQWIGRLENEMHRAIRLVVDTSIHTRGWSRERAIQYSLDHEPGDQESVISEIERYMAIPGQALAYKLGEQKILALKKKAQQQLGSRYDDRDFHDEILKDGALPLSVLDEKITNWIQKLTQKNLK